MNWRKSSALPRAAVALFARLLDFSALDPHMQETMRGSAVAFTLLVIGRGIGFAFNVVLARLLGAEGAGVYYLALTVTTLATVVGRLGLDNALLRFTAASASQDDWRSVAGVYARGMWIALGASLATTVLVAGSAPWIAQGIFREPSLAGPLRLMALGILPTSLLNLHAEMLKALKRIRDAVLVQSVGIPLLGLPLLALLGGMLGVAGAALAYVAATALTLVAGTLLWRRATPETRNVAGYFDTRLLVTTSLPLFWVAAMEMVRNMTDTIALGIWADSQSVGIYNAATRVGLLTSFILTALNIALAPQFADLYARGAHQHLSMLARNALKLMALLASPPLLLFVLAPRWVLGIFGPEFTAGALPLAILAVGQFINVLTGPVGLLLIMSEHEKIQRDNALFSGLLNVLLNVALVPPLGIVGAAIATAASLTCKNVVALWLVRRHLSIRLWAKPRYGD